MFNEYPNTNFHELNADWILAEINKFNTKIEGIEEDIVNIVDEKTEELQKLKLGYVTPEMFGAVGDGVVDDKDAINAALASGYPVFFGAKTYNVSDTIVIKRSINRYVIFNGTTLVSNTANPIINIGSNERTTEYYNMCILGALTVDMRNMVNTTGVILDAGLYGGFVENVRVLNLGYMSTGIIVGGESVTTASFEIGKLDVYGRGSDLDSTGIIINTYDSNIHAIRTLSCTKGVIVNGSANTFHFIHTWSHFYNNFTKVNFEKTVGLIANGYNKYYELYNDSSYIGLDAVKGAEISIYTYANDMDNSISESNVYPIKCYTFHPVTINNYSSSCNMNNVTIHDLHQSNQTNTTGVVCNKWFTAPLRDYNVQGKHSILSELFNANYGLMPTNVCNFSAVTTNYYLVGYIKCQGGTINFKIGSSYRAVLDIEIKTNLNGFESIKCTKNLNPNFNVYYGAGVTHQNALYVPIYLKFTATGNNGIMCDVVSSVGEVALYHDYCDLPGQLLNYVTVAGLTEIVPTFKYLTVNYVYTGTLNVGDNNLEIQPSVTVPTGMTLIGFTAMNAIAGYYKSYNVSGSTFKCKLYHPSQFAASGAYMATAIFAYL